MDIGTKSEPGRELAKVEVDEISGGHIAPNLDEIPSGHPGDATGEPAGGPVDYSNAG
jgi:hypothetical protein